MSNKKHRMICSNCQLEKEKLNAICAHLLQNLDIMCAQNILVLENCAQNSNVKCSNRINFNKQIKIIKEQNTITKNIISSSLEKDINVLYESCTINVEDDFRYLHRQLLFVDQTIQRNLYLKDLKKHDDIIKTNCIACSIDESLLNQKIIDSTVSIDINDELELDTDVAVKVNLNN